MHNEELRSAQGFDQILQNSFNEIYLFDADSLRYLKTNDGALKNLGYSANELEQLTPLDIKPLYTRESFEVLIAPLRRGEQQSLRFETTHRRKDGTTYPVQVRFQLVEAESPVFLAIVQDITEHKIAEQNQKAPTRAHKLLRACGTLLIHAENEQQLLDDICKLAIETGGYLMAWVGVGENDAAKTVRPVALSGYEEGYLDNVKISWSDTELGQGPTGTAIRTGVSVANLDCQKNPKMAPWRNAVAKRGYQSSIALPLICNRYLYGALTIYSAEPHAFIHAEVAVLEELANNLALGIATLRTCKARRRAEQETRELSVLLDVDSELRCAQVALDESRERYVDLYEFAPIGYLTLNSEGMIVEVNLTGATLLGMERKNLLNRHFDGFVSPEDRDQWHSHYLNVLRRVGGKACELKIQQSDGTHFHAQLDCHRTRSDGASMMRVALADISERILTQEQLRRTDASLRLMLESVTDCSIVMLDPKGYVQSWNIGAQRINGYREEEIVGQYFSQFYPREDIDSGRPHRVLDAVIAQGRHEDEGYRVRKDGSTFWASVVITTMMDADGELCGFVKLTRDITERRHLEQLLMEKNVELEHAKAMAEKANLAKSDFISSMSHELRTPLNAILGFAQLLQGRLQSPTGIVETNLQQILNAGWYLLELINEILDLAVIESGKLSLSQEPLSVARVLLECQALVETQAQDRDIKLTFPKFDYPYLAFADPIRLKQVLINLLSNAIKYNRAHGTVEVTCCVSTPGRIRIGIKDSGMGLPAEKLEQLFQPFNRLGQEHGAEVGTGLGLVVTRRLIDLMEGTIGVESVVGVGSEFWIELIQADMPQLSAEIKLPAELPPTVRANTGQHILLYVEDNPANLMLVEQIIEGHPHLKLLSARDGNQGVAQARAHQPDVILMDINLPGISGIEAMNILRKDPTTKHIPIIALSANAMLRDIEKGLEAGFFRYLTKPIRIDELENALETALKQPAEDEARFECMRLKA
jgi:PAS domain S-box-containing protein